jgi:nucleoside-diphosphate-sugar epimerase
MGKKMNILITGASGFLGGNLVNYLDSLKIYNLIVLNRRKQNYAENIIQYIVPNFSGKMDFKAILGNVDVVIHCAGVAHKLENENGKKNIQYDIINHKFTQRLTENCLTFDVKKLIFISTIKINGETTDGRAPFDENDEYNGTDCYARSKFLAEESIKRLCSTSDVSYTIIRTPLIYGLDTKANFKALEALIWKNIPLPFAAMQNKRSLIGIKNIVVFIEKTISKGASDNQTFVVCDEKPYSTTELIKNISTASGKKARLFYLPTFILKILFLILGRQNDAPKMLSSLEINASKAENTLNWKPKFPMVEQLKRGIN